MLEVKGLGPEKVSLVLLTTGSLSAGSAYTGERRTKITKLIATIGGGKGVLKCSSHKQFPTFTDIIHIKILSVMSCTYSSFCNLILIPEISLLAAGYDASYLDV